MSDCAGRSTLCNQEISEAATELAAATEDVSKAVINCDYNGNSECGKDITSTGQNLALSAKAISNSIKDCSFSIEK